MRAIVILLVLLSACAVATETPIGGRSVSVGIKGCSELKTMWIAEQIQSFGWYTSTTPEVTIRCVDTGPHGGAEEYLPGSVEVLLDQTKTNDEFSVRKASGHGLIHWMIMNGPRPEYVSYHVCDWAYNDAPPPNCYPLQRASLALMAPSLDDVSEYRVTEVDKDFINWATRSR